MRNLLNFHAFGASARYKLECSLYKNVLHFVDNNGLRYKKETLMAKFCSLKPIDWSDATDSS